MIETPISEILEINQKTIHKLASDNIYRGYDLTFANEHYLTKPFSMRIAHTIHELKGQSCI